MLNKKILIVIIWIITFRLHTGSANGSVEKTLAGDDYVWVRTKASESAIPAMVFIPGGTITMGLSKSDEEINKALDSSEQMEFREGRFRNLDLWGAYHSSVQESVGDFYMSKNEVSVGEYMAYLDAVGEGTNSIRLRRLQWNQLDNPRVVSDIPMGSVSVHQAENYCEWLSGITGIPFRLPTEVEWEFVAKGGSNNFIFPTENTLPVCGWSPTKFSKLGYGEANIFGVWGLASGVSEWCTVVPSYPPKCKFNSGTGYIRKGGCAMFGDSSDYFPEQYLCASRYCSNGSGHLLTGIRIVRDSD